MLAATPPKSLIRKRMVITPCDERYISVKDQSLLNFAGNDYLGLAHHHDVKTAFANAAYQYGVGSTASPQISGYTTAHDDLERAFANFLGRDRALLFNSGYHANLAVMSVFASRHSRIVADKYCHASLLDGMQLSRSIIKRYQHQDLTHAHSLLAGTTNALLVSESIFSMQGSITNINSLALLAKQHQSILVMDDAHGIGVIGHHGKGIVEHLDIGNNLACLVTPFGKAIGSMGAMVSGNHDMIESLLQHARTYRYSTALPPAICVATLTAIRIIQTQTWRREKLHALIQLFNREARHRELPLLSSDTTPIRCLMIGDNQHTIDLQAHLQQHGFYVAGIRPPTVPKGTARLRISLNCMHEEKDIIALLDRVKTAWPM